MKLEWLAEYGGQRIQVVWEDGQLSGDATVQSLADLLVEWGTEVLRWRGMWYITASLEEPEAAWGTVLEALRIMDANILEQPDPPFEPPMEDGVVY